MKHWKAVIAPCGSCIALSIGSSFATMQEVLQYKVSSMSLFWVVTTATALICIYTDLSFAANRLRPGFSRGGDIYKEYCGKYVGAFSTFFCYMSFVVMLGGANFAAVQQWGLPNGALVISAVSVVSSTIGFDVVLAAIDGNVYKIAQIGDGNPLASGASCGGFAILWFAAFLAEVGARNRLSEVNKGMLLYRLFVFGVAVLCCVVLISNIDVLYNADIPALVLAKQIGLALSLAFAVIVFVGICTSAVPLLWTGVRRLAEEGVNKYRLITVFGGVFWLRHRTAGLLCASVQRALRS